MDRRCAEALLRSVGDVDDRRALALLSGAVCNAGTQEAPSVVAAWFARRGNAVPSKEAREAVCAVIEPHTALAELLESADLTIAHSALALLYAPYLEIISSRSELARCLPLPSPANEEEELEVCHPRRKHIESKSI